MKLFREDLGENICLQQIKPRGMKKKGMQLMVETYVIIILALLIAVVLIVIWDVQTGKFSSYIKEVMGKSNVDGIVASCNSFVARGAVYEYCCSLKEVKYQAGKETVSKFMTCKDLSNRDFGSEVRKMDCKEAGCQE